MVLGWFLKDATDPAAKFKILRADHRIQTLGEGVSGTTELYSRETEPKYYVVKTYYEREKYETKSEYQERVLHEYHILKQLDHVNIIKALNYSVSYDVSKVSIYLEAGTPDLQKLVKDVSTSALDVAEVWCLWKQTCLAVQYLHGLGYCHRDLKLSNLVLDPHTGLVKIIDWATAVKSVPGEPEVGLVGSLGYAAPETYAQIKYNGQKADIWSLGIILFYLANKRLPWKSAQHSDKRFSQYKATFTDGGSKRVRDALLQGLLQPESTGQLLQVNPESRVNIDELCDTTWFIQLPCCVTSTCGFDHLNSLQATK